MDMGQRGERVVEAILAARESNIHLSRGKGRKKESLVKQDRDSLNMTVSTTTKKALLSVLQFLFAIPQGLKNPLFLDFAYFLHCH